MRAKWHYQGHSELADLSPGPGSDSTCTPGIQRQFFLDIKLIDGCDSLAPGNRQTWPFSAFCLKPHPALGLF